MYKVSIWTPVSVHSNVGASGAGNITWTSPESYTLTPGSNKSYCNGASITGLSIGVNAVFGRVRNDLGIGCQLNPTNVYFTGTFFKKSSWLSVTWYWYNNGVFNSQTITDSTTVKLTRVTSIPGIRQYTDGSGTFSPTGTEWVSPGKPLPNDFYFNYDSVFFF